MWYIFLSVASLARFIETTEINNSSPWNRPHLEYIAFQWRYLAIIKSTRLILLFKVIMSWSDHLTYCLLTTLFALIVFTFLDITLRQCLCHAGFYHNFEIMFNQKWNNWNYHLLQNLSRFFIHQSGSDQLIYPDLILRLALSRSAPPYLPCHFLSVLHVNSFLNQVTYHHHMSVRIPASHRFTWIFGRSSS